MKKNRNERQPDNLLGIENKDKSKARLSLGQNRIVDVKNHVIWQSLLSPLSRDSARGGPAERTKRYKARDSTRKIRQNEYSQYYDKVYKAKLVSLDLGRDRETGGRRKKRDRLWEPVTCAPTLCGLGQRDRDWSWPRVRKWSSPKSIRHKDSLS